MTPTPITIDRPLTESELRALTVSGTQPLQALIQVPLSVLVESRAWIDAHAERLIVGDNQFGPGRLSDMSHLVAGSGRNDSGAYVTLHVSARVKRFGSRLIKCPYCGAPFTAAAEPENEQEHECPWCEQTGHAQEFVAFVPYDGVEDLFVLERRGQTEAHYVQGLQMYAVVKRDNKLTLVWLPGRVEGEYPPLPTQTTILDYRWDAHGELAAHGIIADANLVAQRNSADQDAT